MSLIHRLIHSSSFLFPPNLTQTSKAFYKTKYYFLSYLSKLTYYLTSFFYLLFKFSIVFEIKNFKLEISFHFPPDPINTTTILLTYFILEDTPFLNVKINQCNSPSFKKI